MQVTRELLRKLYLNGGDGVESSFRAGDQINKEYYLKVE